MIRTLAGAMFAFWFFLRHGHALTAAVYNALGDGPGIEQEGSA